MVGLFNRVSKIEADDKNTDLLAELLPWLETERGIIRPQKRPDICQGTYILPFTSYQGDGVENKITDMEMQSVYFRGCYDGVGYLKKAGIL